MAYANLVPSVHVRGGRQAHLAWGEKARALAEQLGDDEPLLYALGNMAQLAMLNREPGAPHA